MGVSISNEPRNGEVVVKESKSNDHDIRIFRGEDYLRTIIPQMPGYENKVPYEKDTIVDELDFSDLLDHAHRHIMDNSINKL